MAPDGIGCVQSLEDVEPLSDLGLELGQLLQSELPVLGSYRPVGQFQHELRVWDDCGIYLPVWQLRHEPLERYSPLPHEAGGGDGQEFVEQYDPQSSGRDMSSEQLERKSGRQPAVLLTGIAAAIASRTRPAVPIHIAAGGGATVVASAPAGCRPPPAACGPAPGVGHRQRGDGDGEDHHRHAARTEQQTVHAARVSPPCFGLPPARLSVSY